MVRSLGLNHINLNVTDLERSERFYLAAFGLEVRFREGDDMVFVGSPGARDLITLCQAKPGEAIGRWRRLAFRFPRRACGIRCNGRASRARRRKAAQARTSCRKRTVCLFHAIRTATPSSSVPEDAQLLAINPDTGRRQIEAAPAAASVTVTPGRRRDGRVQAIGELHQRCTGFQPREQTLQEASAAFEAMVQAAAPRK